MVCVFNMFILIFDNQLIEVLSQFSEDKNYCRRPLILSKTDNYGIEGQSLIFMCQIDCVGKQYWSKDLMDISSKWTFPQNSTAEQVSKYSLCAFNKYNFNNSMQNEIGWTN